MRPSSKIVPILAFLAIAGAILASWLGGSLTPGRDAQAEELGRIALTDETGAPTTLAAFRGRPVVILFGYLSCPDVCPTNMAYMGKELASLGSSRHLVQPIFISVDPKRDQPANLQKYVRYFGEDIRGLTGREEDIQALVRRLGAYVEYGKPDATTGQYLVAHSSSFYLLDKDGRLAATLSPPHPQGALSSLLGGARASSTPDLEIKRAVLKLPPPGAPSAALYLSLHNGSSRPLEITSISVLQAKSSMLHETVTDAQGVSRMEHRPQLVISPHETLEMAPGGIHVMVTGLPSPLDAKMVLDVRIEGKGLGALHVKASVEP
jgi:protein SCO1/2